MVFPAGVEQTGKVLKAAEPFVRAAVLEKYGQDADKPNVCPGEKNCLRFQSAAGNTQREKERNACTGCELFGTKRERGRKSHEGLSHLVDAATYVQRRRDSGYPVPEWKVTSLMLEVLLMLDEGRDHQERVNQFQMRQILMAGFHLKTD